MRVDQRAKFGEVALWAVASMFVFGTHAGIAVWAMSKNVPKIVVNEAVQSAIMIELAPEPEAVTSEEQEIAVDEVDTEEVLETPQPVKQEPPEEAPQEQPVEEVAELVEPEPLETEKPEDLVEPEIVDVPDIIANIVPTKRPVISKPKPKKKKPKKKKSKPSPAPKAKKQTRKAKVRAKKAKRTAARQSSRGVRGSNMTPARWKARLTAHIERHKRYPSGSNYQRGLTVWIRLKINAGGKVVSLSLRRSSGNASLDKAALATVRRSSPVPPPPPGVNKTITASIRFD